MRQYEPIWTKLKNLPLQDAKAKGVSITANRRLHPRIIKAVIKEKWLDIPYKISKDPLKVRLDYVQRGAVLTFFLTVSEKTITSECV